MSNGYGNVQVSRAVDMAYYDAAPPQLRWLIRNAVGSFSAPHLTRRYWQNRKTMTHAQALADCAGAIMVVDQGRTLLDYGPTHPEAQGAMREALA